MEVNNDYIPISNTKRPGIKIQPTSITIHSTANENSTARNERNWLTNPTNTRAASWHICIDEKEAIEAIPLNEMAYHSGSTNGNKTSIGIEICESGNREKVLQNAIEIVAKMLYERKWDVSHIKRHYDWSGKICPRILSANNWAGWVDFVKKISIALEKLTQGEEEDMEKRYNSVAEMPDWAKATIEKLINKKLLQGDENGKLDLSLDMIRIFIIHDRAGLYENVIVAG